MRYCLELSLSDWSETGLGFDLDFDGIEKESFFMLLRLLLLVILDSIGGGGGGEEEDADKEIECLDPG